MWIGAFLSDAVTVSPFPGGGSYSPGLLFVIIIFILIAVRRIYSGMSGRLYSTGRLIRLPVIYVLLTVVSVFVFGIISIYPALMLLLMPVATMIGYRYANKCSFFYRGGRIYYRRQAYVMVFWLVSYIARIIIEFTLPFNLLVEVALSAILSVTTGIIIGEALNIRRMYHEFVSINPLPSSGGDAA